MRALLELIGLSVFLYFDSFGELLCQPVCAPETKEPVISSKYYVNATKVCTENFQTTVVESYTSYYRSACWVVFSCKRERTSYRQKTISKQKQHEYRIRECIKGYRLGENLTCIPDCSDVGGCLFGDCTNPSVCECYPGYTGQACKEFCPYQTFGIGCRDTCECKNNATCSHVNGSCTCAAGWEGQSCSAQCSKGWGDRCENVCSCINGTCHHITGKCLCSKGFTGDKCESKCPSGTYDQDCKLNCTCKNGANCDHVYGACSCSSGWEGKTCSIPCPPWKYGDRCSLSCQCSNQTAHGCNHTSGTCDCKSGYFGDQCSKCPEFRFGEQCVKNCSCQRNTTVSCDHVNGACICKEGFNGGDCTNNCSSSVVISADKIKNKDACLKECNCTEHGVCQNTTGFCICYPGFNGTRCENKCLIGTYGTNCAGICECTNGDCSTTDGSCFCDVGWTGPACSLPCDEGMYGQNCEQKCECGFGWCDRFNGSCTCFDEYQGERCDQKCKEGLYGRNCSSECKCNKGNSIHCHAMTGNCTCTVGWLTPTCDKEQQCELGFYGKDCQMSCKCSNHVHCDSRNGYCTCKPGFVGQFCEYACSSGYYGTGCAIKCTCKHSSKCDHITGACTCLPGYTGPMCDTACKDDTFGLNCTRKCTCHNGGVCDVTNGHCDCREPGWTGRDCSIKCPAWTHGRNCSLSCSCYQNNTKECLPSGKCLCKDGFTDTDCTAVCKPGIYGPNCAQTCKCSEHSNMSISCDVQTGQCSCLPGYKGIACDQECPPGSFGRGCTNDCPCNKTGMTGYCDHEMGHCHCIAGLKGNGFVCNETCSNGTYGGDCRFTCSCEKCDPVHGCFAKHSGGDLLKVYILVSLAALALVALIIAFVVLRRRRKIIKLFEKKYDQSVTKKQLTENDFQLAGSESNPTFDENDGTYQDVNGHQSNPIYETGSLTNPVYSLANGVPKGDEYATLFDSKKSQQNQSENYSKLGPVSTNEKSNCEKLHNQNQGSEYDVIHDQRHSNIYCNALYGERVNSAAGSSPHGIEDAYDCLGGTLPTAPNTAANTFYDSLQRKNNVNDNSNEEYSHLGNRASVKSTSTVSNSGNHDNIRPNELYDHLGHSQDGTLTTANITSNQLYDSFPSTRRQSDPPYDAPSCNNLIPRRPPPLSVQTMSPSDFYSSSGHEVDNSYDQLHHDNSENNSSIPRGLSFGKKSQYSKLSHAKGSEESCHGNEYAPVLSMQSLKAKVDKPPKAPKPFVKKDVANETDNADIMYAVVDKPSAKKNKKKKK